MTPPRAARQLRRRSPRTALIALRASRDKAAKKWRLAHIAARHDLAEEQWVRARLGRNIVFVGEWTVVKLGPPCWPGEMAREEAALRFVVGRLPVTTSVLLAIGMLDGWDYLVQARLPGTNLWELWNELEPAERASLAEQHGTIMAALHALPIADAPPALRFDWDRLLAMQRSEWRPAMQQTDLDPALIAQVESYLTVVEPVLSHDADLVLLHGDLTHLNLLVEQQDGYWKITALIDWGDAKIGPRTHELISPGVHMYCGDREALARWYRGYGSGVAVDEHLVMARALLHYPDNFARLIHVVPGAANCSDWPEIARCFWHLSG